MFWIFGRPVEVCQAVNKNFMVVCVMFVILLTFQNVTSEFFLILNIYSLSYVSARNFCVFYLMRAPQIVGASVPEKTRMCPSTTVSEATEFLCSLSFLKKKKKSHLLGISLELPEFRQPHNSLPMRKV